MLRFFNKRIHNRKGFTLIELIVVIAILGIIALIAIPRYANLQAAARVKAEGATASEIINAARVQESDNNGVKVVALVSGGGATTAATGLLMPEYMKVPTTPTYTIAGGGAADYEVSWTTTAAGFTAAQKVIENTAWTPAKP